MLVIGIVGPKASGKETIAKYLHTKYGARYHSHSEILDDVLAVLHMPNTRENEIKLVGLRKKFGENTLINALNKRIVEDLQNASEMEAITGIRFQNEFDNIRTYPKNIIISVDAPLDMRYKWQLARSEKSDDQSMSYEDFLALEKKETEIHIKELGKQADYQIVNDGSETDLYVKVDEIIKAVKI